MGNSFLLLSGIGLFALVAGALGGWFFRSRLAARDKSAMNARWRDLLNAQRTEQDRLAGQNRTLMETISEHRQVQSEADARSRALSESVQEAFALRDAAEERAAAAERRADDLDQALAERPTTAENSSEKDKKIFRLSRELESWQNRLPPLLEKFRNRDLEAQQLEVELDAANARIRSLESRAPQTAGTRIEPLDDAALAEGEPASNEQFGDSMAVEALHEAADAEQSFDPGDEDGAGSDLDVVNGGSETAFEDVFDAALACGSDADEGHVDTFAGEVFADVGSQGVDEWLDASEDASPTGAEEFRDPAPGAHDGVQAEPARTGTDDLKAIKGVGPAIEKILKGLGIFTYRQIADLSEAEIDRVAGELRGFRSRIYREDWIGQARTLDDARREAPADT